VNLIPEFQQGAYQARWGISDFYEENRIALLAWLESGENFDTGWYGAKKEIHSGRILREGDFFTCEAWCSDDFDTEGRGEATFLLNQLDDKSPAAVLEHIIEALDMAMEAAEENRRDNEVYEGFSIGEIDLTTGKRSNWVYTFIAPKGEGHYLPEPPGDHYFVWGWQEETDLLPFATALDFERFAMDPNNEEPGMTIGTWRIDRWKP
jgi:hypothetical protein